MKPKFDLSDDSWKEKLSPERYRVLRQKGTEAPFSGKLYHNEENGTYSCAGCGTVLFTSDSKYDSGSGWPSFFKPVDQKLIHEERDTSHGMTRTEISCATCGGHLGHVFEDGPNPTGLRYCVNSLSLAFDKTDS